MAGSGSLGEFFDHGIYGDHFMEYMDLVDFPMESLEGGGLHRGDWDAKMQALGTIFMKAKPLLGSPLASSVGNNGNATSNVVPSPSLHIEVSSELKPPIKSIKEASEASIQSIKEGSGASIPLQNDSSSHVSESRVFQSPSPVSLPESTSSCSGEKNMSTSSENLIPARAHTKHSESSTTDPQLGMPPISRNGKREPRKRKFSQPSGALSNSKTKQNSSQRPAASKKCSVTSSSVPSRHKKYTKQCSHCGTGKTPQWRGGPMGPKTLCNACGVQYRFGRLFPEYRPAASPSFVPSLHSNFHLKVIEMRKKATKKSSTVKAETPMLPPPPPPPHKAVTTTTTQGRRGHNRG